MTATGHAVVGAAIASKIPDLRIALPLALLSHFLGDALPHWDTGFYWKQKGMKRVFLESLVDVLGGYILVFLIFILYLHASPINVYLGVLTAQLPDYLEFPYFFLHIKLPPFTWVNDLQHIFHKKAPLPWGLMTQMVVGLVFIAWAIS